MSMVDLVATAAEAKKRKDIEQARKREAEIRRYTNPNWLRRLFRRGLRYDVARMSRVIEDTAYSGKFGVKFIAPGLFGGLEEWKYGLLRDAFEATDLKVCKMLSRDAWNPKVEWLGGMAVWWGPSRNLPEGARWVDYGF